MGLHACMFALELNRYPRTGDWVEFSTKNIPFHFAVHIARDLQDFHQLRFAGEAIE